MDPQPTPNTTAGRVARFADLISVYAHTYHMPTWLLAGLIAAESDGDPYAIRVEPGWLRRHWRGSVAAVRATAGRKDDRWLRYPDLASTSYGLMQVLFIVAVERRVLLDYPTQLCDPRTNLIAGCSHYDHLAARFGRNPSATLLRYNGGGNPDYPGLVYHHARLLMEHDAAQPLRNALGPFVRWQ